jgi:hypothetical protein
VDACHLLRRAPFMASTSPAASLAYVKHVRYSVRMADGKKRKAYALHVYLDPEAAGILAMLAGRESAARPAARRVLERLLREEADRLAPGLWDVATDHTGSLAVEGLTPREVSEGVAERAAAVLRARAQR